MSNKIEVKLFYSSKRELNVLKQYEEGINYLHEINANVQIIDVDKNPEKAEQFKIMATPALHIRTNLTNQSFIGLSDGFKQLLIQDLQGKSILHLLGFKEGRALGRTLKVDVKNRNEVEQLLKERLSLRGIYKFKLEIYKPNDAYAEVSLIPDEMVEEHGKTKTPAGFKIAAFLGGIFTELFKKEVIAEETSCKKQGYEKCIFKISEKHIPEEETRKKIKGMLVVKAKAHTTPSKLKEASKTSRYINFEKSLTPVCRPKASSCFAACSLNPYIIKNTALPMAAASIKYQ